MKATDIALSGEPRAVHRRDYRAPDFLLSSVELSFDLEPSATRVRSRLALKRNPESSDPAAALVLDGCGLELLSIALDGERLPPGSYRVEPERLTISDVPERCLLEIETRTDPAANTAFEGLYHSNGTFCTQCEAHGFRRITYFMDRPDVLTNYKVRIEADKGKYPVLLSNGNRIGSGELAGGRHWVEWQDPFAKPCYLFALVAGDLACHRDRFVTQSGREVAIEIYVEHQNSDRCEHAATSLKKAMRWDEETFGLEYDLDVYMIVAVNDFNMGAMENKGLNVFNDKFVLAQPETATDTDYENIEGVIAHEYFHNWTGNRVTCRDWFQLSLKEGLTVFRDQCFSADMNSQAVKRIQTVTSLRTIQFPEDAGPTAHPVRPDSYIEMNNFYTATVYNKGAEVVRMIRSLIGVAGFRAGMDLYFQRHDGQAVTCDDFCAAMEDANGLDLGLFRRWYGQAGTPTLAVRGEYDAARRTYTLSLTQTTPPTPGQEHKQALQIPLALGLVGPDGQDQPLRLEGEEHASKAGTRVFSLREAETRLRFVDLDQPPVPSLLRDFSAPVKLSIEREPGQLAFLMANDSDAFNRWEAGQEMALGHILNLLEDLAAGRELSLDGDLAQAFGQTLAQTSTQTGSGADKSFLAYALSLPNQIYMAENVGIIDPEAIHKAQCFVRRSLAARFQSELSAALRANEAHGAYSKDCAAIGSRRLKNVCLDYLASLADAPAIKLAWDQFAGATNMTDVLASLMALSHIDCDERRRALSEFYERWRDDPLVLDKWFAIQATSSLPGTLSEVEKLAAHEAFSMKNPNKVRSLIGAFAVQNPLHFHAKDGSGHRFLADKVIELDGINPQITSRIVRCFSNWRRFEPSLRDSMHRELERVAATEDLSKDVFEMVNKSLDKI